MINYSVPSFMLSARLSPQIADMRERLSNVATEATTGMRSDLTKHLSGRIGTAMLSQKALGDLSSQRELLALRGARLEIVEHSLTRVQDSSEGLAVRMAAAIGIGNEFEQAAVARDAASALEGVFSALNAHHGGRYLFAGDATATKPFGDPDGLIADIRQIALTAPDAATFQADLDTYFNSPAGGWQQTIYQGTANASDPHGVTGTEPALTALISNLAVLAISAPGETSLLDSNPDIIAATATQLTAAQSAVTTLRADIGTLQKRVADDVAALDVEESILTEEFSRIAGRDQYEAASELQTLEANLEASYLLTARLSNLTLLNFLR